MTATLPPSLPVDELKFSAKIDYVTFTNGGIKIDLPDLTGSTEWNREKGSSNWNLTIHDPTAADLRAIATAYENPMVMAFELAIDLAPKAMLDPVNLARLLETTFAAVAARFRPEDKALWDYGLRGAVSGRGQKPKPLERRFPRPDEEVLYGRRGDFMQAKLYLKTLDQGVILPLPEQRVRMEVTLKRWACMQFGLANAKDLFGYRYRSKFTTHFRIIDRPEVRLLRGLKAPEIEKRTKRMLRAWKTAGVGKFPAEARPREDVMEAAVAKIRARARAQLPAGQFKLRRDQAATDKIGIALMGLQRRMKAR